MKANIILIFYFSCVNQLMGNKISRENLPQGKAGCPFDIYPCICRQDYDVYGNYLGISLDCSKVLTNLELQTILSKTYPSNEFYEFFMDQSFEPSNITSIDYGTFSDKTFVKVRLVYIDFQVSVDAFDDMKDTLEWLYFNGVPFTTFNKIYTSFTKLKTIYIWNSNINVFDISSRTLESLTIAYSKLAELQPENLAYNLGTMQNLIYLDVSNNQLTKSPSTDGYPKLTDLYFTGNYITTIETESSTRNYIRILYGYENGIADIGEDSIRMATDGFVNFWENQLTKLDQNKWENIFINASCIRIYWNPLDCGCSIGWLIQNPTYMNKLGGIEACENGTALSQLDKNAYDGCY